MPVALIAWSTELDLSELVRQVKAASGVETRGIAVGLDGRVGDLDSAGWIFVVFPEPGVVHLGERLHALRQRLAPSVVLCACTLRPTSSDRNLLLECGASKVITPEGWRPEQVADRIVAELASASQIEPRSFRGIVGAAPQMREAYDRIGRFAPLREPVLIQGETGTGKERVATALNEGNQSSRAFLALNCAALTPELLESELFGHERGAFSGAVAARKGLLVEAGVGTVFLDEIGDLSLSSQAKLLRVIDERSVRPVGANRWTPVGARLLFATHRNLEQACADGRFREDLFYRISTLTIHLPPLRERKSDLVLLAEHFLTAYNQEYPGKRFAPPGAFDPLFRYDWPGNVRELRKAIWQAATFAASPDGPIGTLSLQEWSTPKVAATSSRWQLPFDPRADSWREVQDRLRKAYFQAVLGECEGNRDEAAKRAGLSRSQLYEILKQFEARDNRA